MWPTSDDPGEDVPGRKTPHRGRIHPAEAGAAISTIEGSKQNITLRLDRQTLRRAKILAAKRNTSISGLLTEQIEALVGEDHAYEQAERRALSLLDRGFHLGGTIESTRDEWHER